MNRYIVARQESQRPWEYFTTHLTWSYRADRAESHANREEADWYAATFGGFSLVLQEVAA